MKYEIKGAISPSIFGTFQKKWANLIFDDFYCAGFT